MKTHIQEQESRIIEFCEKMFRQRYRLAIACGKISSGKSEIAQFVSKQLKANYINLAVELLPETTKDNFSPTLGAYGPDDLIKYVLESANCKEINFLIIDQIEPLLSTFGRAKVAVFFRMLSQAEPLKPVLIVTYLKKQIDEAVFPKERIIFF